MVQKDGQERQSALAARCSHGVGSVMDVRVCLGSTGKVAEGYFVKDPLVWKVLRTQEYKVLQGVRQAIVGATLGRHDYVRVHLRAVHLAVA